MSRIRLNIPAQALFIPAMRRTDHDSQGGNYRFLSQALCLRDIRYSCRAPRPSSRRHGRAHPQPERRHSRRAPAAKLRHWQCFSSSGRVDASIIAPVMPRTDRPGQPLGFTRAVVKVQTAGCGSWRMASRIAGANKITVVGISQTAEHLEDDRPRRFSFVASRAPMTHSCV